MNKLFTCSKTTYYALAAIILAAFSVVGCTEKDVSIDPPVEKPTTAIPPVTLDNYNDYNPRKTVDINIDYSGANCSKALFEIYAENPYEVVDGELVFRSDLIALAAAFTDKEGRYTGTAELPLDIKEAYIYSPDFGVPRLYKTDIVGNAIRAEIDFENEIDLSAMLKEVDTKASVEMRKDGYFMNTLSDFDWKTGRPNNIESIMKIDEDMKYAMKIALPEGKKAPASLISDDVDIILYEDASSVKISYFGGEGQHQSGFAYYCYPKDAKRNEIQSAAKKAYIIFPNAHKSALGPYSGVTVQLKYIDKNGNLKGNSFPKGTRIGFMLLPNSWNDKRYDHEFYSTKSLNKDKRSHTAMFTIKNEKGEPINVISMEDQRNDSDYNDVAFVITSNPEKAIELPDVTDPEEPDDTDRTHSLEYKGLLAFEDNWPSGGDYDMNDVVVKYNSKVTFNEKNLVTKIEDNFTLSWSGANYSNGFGYQVPFDLTKETEVKFTGKEGAEIVGSDVIILAKDVKSSLGIADVSANDMPDNVTPSTYTIVTTFNTPVKLTKEFVPPYNPFIKKSGSNTEIHLVNHRPTKLGDNKWPQTGTMDIADGESTFYVSGEGYPFAFHLDARKNPEAMNINLKNEGEAIDKTYPKFVKWAKDGREEDVTWW